jgi:hypothetical protein
MTTSLQAESSHPRWRGTRSKDKQGETHQRSERLSDAVERGVTRRHATWWTKRGTTRRWIKWMKFIIGFKDDEWLMITKLSTRGKLVRFSDNEPTVAWRCKSAGLGWQFLIIDRKKVEICHKGHLVQSRDGNFDHIMMSEDRWEWPT